MLRTISLLISVVVMKRRRWDEPPPILANQQTWDVLTNVTSVDTSMVGGRGGGDLGNPSAKSSHKIAERIHVNQIEN